MKDMTLERIAKACGGQLVLPSEGERSTISASKEIAGAVLDSRQVQKDFLFFAVKGEKTDGHGYIGDVFKKGAACVITEKKPEEVKEQFGTDLACWGAYIVVPDSLQALKQIAAFYRSTLSIPIVGITGSVGKTSTKELIAAVLAQKYCVLKTEGNFNNEIGLPLTILRIRKEHTAAVVEMGISDFHEMTRLSAIARPDIGVITNIGQCHLENLGSRDGIFKAKTEMFANLSEGARVCLNGEDDKLSAVKEVNGLPPFFFGLGGNPEEEVWAEEITDNGLFGSDALLKFKDGGEQKIHIPLPGAHMVINAAAAACVGRILGLTGEQIAEGIASVKSLQGRSNLIQGKHCMIIDDCYNANPVSMKAAIRLLAGTRPAESQAAPAAIDQAVTPVTGQAAPAAVGQTVMPVTGQAASVAAPTAIRQTGAKVAILGDMFELGENSDALHEEVGAFAAQENLDRLIFIGENAYHIYKRALALSSAKALSNAKAFSRTDADANIYWYPEKEQFFAALEKDREKLLPDGSIVLVKASHGMDFKQIVEKLRNE